MINVVPKPIRARIALEYRFRLGSAALLYLAAALLIGTILLLPAYMTGRVLSGDLEEQASIADRQITQEHLSAAAQEENAASALFAAAHAQALHPQPSSVLRGLLAVKPAGIALRQAGYDDVKGKIQIHLSGTAASREALLSFKQSLAQAEGVSAVDLPADALAAAENSQFVIIVTYARKPVVSSGNPADMLATTSASSSAPL